MPRIGGVTRGLRRGLANPCGLQPSSAPWWSALASKGGASMDARRWFKTKHLRRGFALFGNVSVNSIQAGSRKAGPPATLIASLQIRSWPKDASFADNSTAYRKGADVDRNSVV